MIFRIIYILDLAHIPKKTKITPVKNISIDIYKCLQFLSTIEDLLFSLLKVLRSILIIYYSAKETQEYLDIVLSTAKLKHNLQTKILFRLKHFEFIVLIAHLDSHRKLDTSFSVYEGYNIIIYVLLLSKTSRRGFNLNKNLDVQGQFKENSASGFKTLPLMTSAFSKIYLIKGSVNMV